MGRIAKVMARERMPVQGDPHLVDRVIDVPRLESHELVNRIY